MDQVKATLQGVNASLSRRNLSPTTQEILRLLASKAEDAIRKDAAGIDHQALLSEMQKINTLNAYVTKRSVDLARLSNLDTVAKLGDYAMMYCQRLKKEADPESAFRKMMWISIHDVLEAEKYARLCLILEKENANLRKQRPRSTVEFAGPSRAEAFKAYA